MTPAEFWTRERTAVCPGCEDGRHADKCPREFRTRSRHVNVKSPQCYRRQQGFSRARSRKKAA